MGYRPEIDNTIVKGKLFKSIKKNFLRNKMNVIKVVRVRNDRFVFHVFLDNGKEVKLNLIKKDWCRCIKQFNLQNLLHSKKVNVPKCIYWWQDNLFLWKVTKWIKGVRLDEVWDYKEPIVAGGEQVAKINSIIDPETKYSLRFKDFSPLNSIWTEDKKLYIIDVDVWPDKQIDQTIVRILIGALRSKNRALAFLEGYEKVRSIEGIIKILERDNWTWRGYSFSESGELL